MSHAAEIATHVINRGGSHVHTVLIERIAEGKTNPRRTVKDHFFNDLVQSVKDHGILQPILIRPCVVKRKPGDGDFDAFEVVAGHRRLAAAREAELTEIPALVRELTDEQALEIQVIENLQRTDLHPLEEAEGYRQLMHTHKYDVARISERIGRSAKYVYDRVKLLSLTKAAQGLFFDDKFTAGHAVILARLKPADQTRALDVAGQADWRGRRGGPLFDEEHSLFSDEEQEAEEAAVKKDPYRGMKPRSVRELQAWVDEHVRFDHAAQDVPDLFPETHVELARAKEEAEKVVFITRDYAIPNDARDPGQKVLTERAWQRADGEEDSKPCEHSVTGVVVIGRGRGQAFKVCTAKEKCNVHWGEWQRERAKRQKHAAKAGSTGEARAAAERDRYKEDQERRDREHKARQKAMPAIMEALAAKVAEAPAGATSALADVVVSALSRFGGSLSPAVPRGKTAEDLVRHLAYNAIRQSANDGWAWESFSKKARAVGVDVAKILKESAPVQTSAKSGVSVKPKRGTCRVCGCTEEKACIDKKTGATCSWVNSAKTLCSTCEGKATPVKAAAKSTKTKKARKAK